MCQGMSGRLIGTFVVRHSPTKVGLSRDKTSQRSPLYVRVSSGLDAGVLDPSVRVLDPWYVGAGPEVCGCWTRGEGSGPEVWVMDPSVWVLDPRCGF